jgi:hypothetical protein
MSEARNALTRRASGLSSGRHIHSPLPKFTSRPSESCTSGRKSSMLRTLFSPWKNMLVIGAMPSFFTSRRMKMRATTPTDVCSPGRTTN